MTRPKTKRIVWAIVTLLALSFVAAMVLPKHPEPIIIRNLSKEDVSLSKDDVSKSSRIAAREARAYARRLLTGHLHHWEIKKFVGLARYYPSIRALSLYELQEGEIAVTVRIEPDDEVAVLVIKKDGKWSLAHPL